MAIKLQYHIGFFSGDIHAGFEPTPSRLEKKYKKKLILLLDLNPQPLGSKDSLLPLSYKDLLQILLNIALPINTPMIQFLPF